jgi:hypothetical protein
LDHLVFAANDLITLVPGRFKELWERDPLSCDLVSIIGVHELVIVDTVWRISPDAFNCRLAAVKGENVIDESLSRFVEREGFEWIWMPIFGGTGLMNFEVLAGGCCYASSTIT